MSRVFDWESVLSEHGVPYRSRGANVASGNLNVACPWCGNDPSFHLGISLDGKGWGCWRNKTHRGKSPTYLLNMLLGQAEATAVIRKYGLGKNSAATRQSLQQQNEPPRPYALEYPEGVADFDPRIDLRFWDYLVNRGFDQGGIEDLFAHWGLKVGRTGRYASRLVIPYYFREAPVFFTSRAISKSEIRYKAQPHDEAVVDPKRILFNHDFLTNSAGVIVCEGPLDALKTTMYGPLPAVALSTNSATDEQLAALQVATRVYLVLDNDDVFTGTAQPSVQGMSLYYDLIQLGVPTKLVLMPKGYKDLAEIPAECFAGTLTLEYLTS